MLILLIRKTKMLCIFILVEGILMERTWSSWCMQAQSWNNFYIDMVKRTALFPLEYLGKSAYEETLCTRQNKHNLCRASWSGILVSTAFHTAEAVVLCFHNHLYTIVTVERFMIIFFFFLGGSQYTVTVALFSGDFRAQSKVWNQQMYSRKIWR